MWNIIFDNEILNEVVRCINVFIGKRLYSNYDIDRDAKTTNLIEIKSVFGIYYTCAL